MIVDAELPAFHRRVDLDALIAEYPVADAFEQGVFRWSQDRLRELQNRRFQHIVEVGWANPFYRRRWTAAGLQPGDIRSLDDLGRLPLFTSDDIKDDQQAHPPFGEIHNLSRADLAGAPFKVQASGGTTGKPRFTVFGPRDWAIQGISSARVLHVQGGRPGDVMQIPATCSLANLGWAYYNACHNFLGVLPLTTGSGVVTPTRKQLEIGFDLGTNIWMSFPEYLTHLAKTCREELGRDIRELKTKLLSTFLGPDTEGLLRRTLEESWGCKAYDQYGTNEVGGGAFECQAQSGLHLMEDMAVFEFVDVETGLPVKDGETGNMVVTILARELPPIIRYNLRDLGRLVSAAPCGCGGTFRRMDHFLGRSDDMVKIRGVNIYPMGCLSAVKSDPRTTGEWLCVAERSEQGGALRDDLTVQVEVLSGVGRPEDLRAHLAARLQSDLGIKVAVELVDEGALAAAANLGREGKAKRLVDRRNLKKP
jgi:phenylacetate-CoA ligase